MSGGFFRGTTADQDTRFSNKHAKLLKSHKFPPELENLVDMTKVKLDVMRPWIAHRVTELLGFEDEVLINFIYGLLEEKVVNGKEIQISLTGFMEKNTGKFMKELWTHLLSAQMNASGVPQQFLDAKEEETRKKQEDTDRITRELKKMKEKEGRAHDEERVRTDREVDNQKAAALEPHSRRPTKFSSKWSADDKESDERNGSKGIVRVSRSPRSAARSLSPPLGGVRSRSISKSMSNSRSHSRSRSLSASPKPVRRSVSSERKHQSLSRRSFTPSPARRRLQSPASRRSRSPVRRRSRSPLRHRSRSPLRRRSRSPIRRSRSPIQRRVRSPIRRRSRSSIRRRSRSPIRRRSRTPIRRTPIRRRSPSPFKRRPRSPYRHRSHSYGSPSPVRGRSPSPMRRPRYRSPSPFRRRANFSARQRSPSPRSMSSSPSGRIFPKRQQRSPVHSPRDGHRIVQRNGPDRTPVSVRSSERDLKGKSVSHNGIGETVLSPSPYNSPSRSVSPPAAGRSPSVERSPIPPKRQKENMNAKDRLDGVKVEDLTFSRVKEDKHAIANEDTVTDKLDKNKRLPEKLASHHSSGAQVLKRKSNNDDGRRNYHELTEDPLRIHKDIVSNDRARESGKGYIADDIIKDSPRHHEASKLPKLSQKVEKPNQSGSLEPVSEESDDQKRKQKRSKREDVSSDDDYSHDSRTEAKKRRKEEKRLKKEDKRKRREERRRKKDSRRSEKLELKEFSDLAKSPYSHDDDDAFSDQKKLEIELREKALESLRAKKGVGH